MSLFGLGKKLGEKIGSVSEKLLYSTERLNKQADLEFFIDEVRNEKIEYLSYQKDYDAISECRPTYEQINQEKVMAESNRNMILLKSLEYILQERLASCNAGIVSLKKSRSSFDSFQYSDGTVRKALDQFFYFIQEEREQLQNQLEITDWRKTIADLKTDTEKRLIDYQKQLAHVEKDVTYMERKLSHSKEKLEKYIDNRNKFIELNEDKSFSNKESNDEKRKGLDDHIKKYEKEIKENIRSLLYTMSVRDQIVCACRRANEKLDLECKKTIGNTLRLFVHRERESIQAREKQLKQLEQAVTLINEEEDVTNFIIRNKSNEEPLIFYSQALNHLGNIEPHKSLRVSESIRISENGRNSGTNGKNRSKDSINASSININELTFDDSDSITSSPRSTINSRPQSPEIIDEYNGNNDTDNDVTKIADLITYNKSIQDTITYFGAIFYMKKGDQPINNNNNNNITVDEATEWLNNTVKTKNGRNIFAASLNTFRSKKVDIGEGFALLGSILFTTLNYCVEFNDIHTAKMLMMLSQTFYRCKIAQNDVYNDAEEEERIVQREYLKETLCDHPIWQDSKFWEQVLWQLILEQFESIPYDVTWHDADKYGQEELVRRVHNVIFSQLMAITHSMLELGCSKPQTRIFMYRMCVIHQLSEGHRHNLLAHIFA